MATPAASVWNNTHSPVVPEFYHLKVFFVRDFKFLADVLSAPLLDECDLVRQRGSGGKDFYVDAIV